MFCGIPVISNSPLGSFVESERCGLVISYNEESLYEAASELLFDKSKRLLLGTNGREAVIRKYNWEQEERKIFKVLNGCFVWIK